MKFLLFTLLSALVVVFLNIIHYGGINIGKD